MSQPDHVASLPGTSTFASNSSATLTSLGDDVEKTAGKKAQKADLQFSLGPSRLTSWLSRIAFFYYYYKTFTFIFITNLIALIIFVVGKDHNPLAPNLGSAASFNLMLALLFRQENFLNMAYEIAASCPQSAPLWFRHRLATVFHYGGAHSGAGAAGVIWYILYTAVTTRDYVVDPNKWALANVAASYILTTFSFIPAAAYPVLQRRYREYFGAVHRFSGWIALSTFWMHAVFSAYQYRVFQAGPPSIGRYLIGTPNFWTLCVSTSCSILSWGRLRRHKVYPEVLSSHAIRLHFKYSNISPFYGIRISTSPLLHCEAFAAVPENDSSGRKGFSLLVSDAGDWAQECIANPPKRMWVRGVPLRGLLYTFKLFRKIVIVATGSGIGSCLSLLYGGATPRRVLWCAHDPKATYGERIIQSVQKVDPDACIWDTRTHGRPDIVAITHKFVMESQAEAVFILSNPRLTRSVVYGMESRGIAAYGPVFDS
ncbi:hypothetical protein C8R43DRAFT_630931 [Mycena crocata]|nr:hypothetical protein C8R43DRAFT_630931 [Mycena crocata]